MLHRQDVGNDAWNRLTEADEGANVVATYRYDGLNRRVSKAVAVRDACGTLTGYDRTDYQYDEAWQVLEERFTGNQCSADTVATAPHAQYVWDIRYVDAPVLRLRDTAGPSCSQPDGDLDDSGDEVVYYTNDANMNVTALVNTSGEVVERYAYEAYGAPTILNGVKDAAGTDTSTSEWDERTVATFQNEILNNGYRYNYETGNNQARRREYSSTLGRWLQPDPAGYVDGMNIYQGYLGNPVAHVDSNGTCSLNTTAEPTFIAARRIMAGLVSKIENLLVTAKSLFLGPSMRAALLKTAKCLMLRASIQAAMNESALFVDPSMDGYMARLTFAANALRTSIKAEADANTAKQFQVWLANLRVGRPTKRDAHMMDNGLLRPPEAAMDPSYAKYFNHGDVKLPAPLAKGKTAHFKLAEMLGHEFTHPRSGLVEHWENEWPQAENETWAIFDLVKLKAAMANTPMHTWIILRDMYQRGNYPLPLDSIVTRGVPEPKLFARMLDILKKLGI